MIRHTTIQDGRQTNVQNYFQLSMNKDVVLKRKKLVFERFKTAKCSASIELKS